jgi:hypothetical protein
MIANANVLPRGVGIAIAGAATIAAALAELALFALRLYRDTKAKRIALVSTGTVVFISHIALLIIVSEGLIVKFVYGYYVSLALSIALLVYFSVSLSLGYRQHSRQPAYASATQKNSDIPKDSGVIVGRNGMHMNAMIKIADGEELIIGRDAAVAHIVVDKNAGKVSRKHCRIIYNGVRMCYEVTDFSSNGTFKENGEKLTANVPTMLPRGTVILLGGKQNSFILN